MRAYRNNPDRLKRSRIFYTILFLFVGSVSTVLLLTLQDLILPVLIGFISAYVAQPGLTALRKRRVPKGISILLLFAGFAFTIFFIGRQIADIIPNEKEKLELRVSIQYKLNETYLNTMGKQSFEDEGNMIGSLVGDELRPFLNNLNAFLTLNKEEEALFYKYVEGYKNMPPISQQVVEYKKEVDTLPKVDLEPTESEKEESRLNLKNSLNFTPKDSKIAALLSAVSNWLITPFVFIFLLLDDGSIKYALIGIVPNRYFEMALTTFDNVDKAIGKYLRGTILQCTLVGISFIVGLLLVGFDFQAAVLIGFTAGLANAIPFLGPVIGLVIGILYSMVVEQIEPIIPFIGDDNAIFAVVITVIIVQLLDNAIYSPLVLGKAVNLHPLVVIIGVSGGSILFGVVGMLFAIPAIVVFKVVISTLYRQLKAYYIIY